MLGFWQHQRSGLLKPLVRSRARSSRVRDVKDKYKLPLSIILLVVVVLWIAQPVTYDTPQGKLTLHATVGKGKTMFMLGPAGTWEFETQKTPIVLRVDLVLNNNYHGSVELWEIFQPIYDLYNSDTAEELLYEFVVYKVFLLLLLGALVGFIHSNGGKYWKRNTAWNMLDGVIMVSLLVAVIAMATVATYDRRPKMSATGYASEVSPVTFLSLTKELSGDFQLPSGYARNQMRGMDVVAKERRSNTSYSADGVFYLFLIADLHGNPRGLEIAEEQFLSSDPEVFAAVLLAGDMVHFSTSAEAEFAFRGWPTNEELVLFVGGNHDDTQSMNRMETFGYTKLSKQSVEVNGLMLAGADDPLAYSLAMSSDNQLLEGASKELAQQWLVSEPRPSLVMVHDIDQAKDLIEVAKETGQELTIVYGHDHELKVEVDDNVVLIQGGTGGASGFDGKGKDPDELYTYQILEYTQQPEPKLTWVYSYSYDDATDAFYFSRTPID